MNELKTVKETLIIKYAYLKTESNNFREILEFLNEATSCKYSISISCYEDSINLYNITMADDQLKHVKLGYYIVIPCDSVDYQDIKIMELDEFKRKFNIGEEEFEKLKNGRIN